MKPRHAWAATVAAAAGAALAAFAGLIPEVAGLGLLLVAKVAAAISSLATAGHAHLTHAAHDPHERLMWGALTVLCLAVLVYALARFLVAFTTGFLVALIAAPILILLVSFLGPGREAKA